MLKVNFIRENPDVVLQGLLKRNFNEQEAREVIDQILETDDQRRQNQQQLDDHKAIVNASSKLIGTLMREKKLDEAETKKKEVALLKSGIQEGEKKLQQAEAALREQLYRIPNIPHQKVPEGKGDGDNVTVYAWGEKPELPANALPHWELIKKYDLIDFDLGIKITGAGFPVYKKKGARLQRALINFFLDEAIRAGYEEILPPIVVNEDSGYGTGQLPDKEGQMYCITEDHLYLIPTAEVPITNLYRDTIIREDDLPVMNVGYTPCFRREAGSWGAHVRGLNRLHQFDKVEIVQIALPENSYSVLDNMCEHVQGLLEKLQLPYKKLLLCGGDTGFNAAITYDMEVWSAAQQRWLEVSSVSNFETYQANRLKLRHKKDGKPQTLHTLNGSALALPRIVAAILENNQSEEGIKIPEVLVDYTGFDLIN